MEAANHESIQIVYATLSRIPSSGAHVIQIVRTCDALASLGVRVLLVVPRRKEFTFEELRRYYGLQGRFNVIRLLWFPPVKKKKGFLFLLSSIVYIFQLVILLYLLKLHTWLRGEKSRLVIFLRERPLIILLYILSPWMIKRTLFEVHDIQNFCGFGERILFSALFHCPKVIATSNYLRNYLDEIGFRKDRIHVIHNAADDRSFSNNVPIVKMAKKIKEVAKGRKVVMYAGSLKKSKNPEFMVDSFKVLNRDDACLVVVGGSSEEIKRLLNYVKRRDVRNVVFLGRVSPASVPHYLKLADILVHNTVPLASLSPLKIFEYMLAKKPIVAPNCPGVNEVLRNGENALLFSPGDRKSMAEKISVLLENPDLARKLAERAYNDAINNYTYKARAKKILKILEK